MFNARRSFLRLWCLNPVNLQIKSLPNSTIIALCQQIKHLGGKALIVGGWVRDTQLNISENPDIDLEVYHLNYKQLQNLFKDKIVAQYPKFGVLKLQNNIDISLPRQEVCTGQKYNDFQITLCPNLDFRLAAKRRDFTINAMGFDPLSSEFFDPYKGYHDLLKKVLRPISPHFMEDAYRVLRAVQFIARFGFSPTYELICFARQMSPTSLSYSHIKHTQHYVHHSPFKPLCRDFLKEIHWDIDI